MKFIKYLLIIFFIQISSLAFSQQPPVKKVETQNKKTKENITQKANIKAVPKANLQQSQLKKINQNKARLQSQKLKKAIRKSQVMRKPIRKKG